MMSIFILYRSEYLKLSIFLSNKYKLNISPNSLIPTNNQFLLHMVPCWVQKITTLVSYLWYPYADNPLMLLRFIFAKITIQNYT